MRHGAQSAGLKTEYIVGRITSGSARERDPAPEPPEFPCIAGIGLGMARVKMVGADRNPDGDEAVNKANQLSRKGLVHLALDLTRRIAWEFPSGLRRTA